MKKVIAVIFGGKSAEHDISIITAYKPIIETITVLTEYTVLPIYITKTGDWYSHPDMNTVTFFQQSNYEFKLTEKYRVYPQIGKEFSVRLSGMFGQTTKVDVVFPAMHGTYGEDGSLQGLLRMCNVPFVGCDMAASAVAMDKVMTKQILESVGIPVTSYVWFTNTTWNNSQTDLLTEIEKLKYPVFIKPVHLGSSIGITKAKNRTELIQAIEVALFYDDKVLVEAAVDPLIEVTLPILGNTELTYGGIEQPQSKSDFFDFTEKYIGNAKTSTLHAYSTIPASISTELSSQVMQYAKTTYTTIGCTGIARIDFLINPKTKTVYVNEVNTMPGILSSHNFKQSGIPTLTLVTKLIELAYERYNATKNIQYTFSSSVLNSLDGG